MSDKTTIARRHRRDRSRRGTTSLFILMGMIPMMGIVAVALEFGNVAVHHKRLQNYVDSRAVGALKTEVRGDQAVELYQFTADGGIRDLRADTAR